MGSPAILEARRSRGRVRSRGSRSLRVAPGAVVEAARNENGHVVEHEGGEGFVHSETGPQGRRDTRPQGACRASDQDGDGEEQGRGNPVPEEGNPRCGDPRHRELTFRADVPEPEPKGQRNPEARQHEGNRLYQGLREGVKGSEGAEKHGPVGCQRIGPEDEEEDPREQEGGEEGNGGNRPLGCPGNRLSLLKEECHRLSPEPSDLPAVPVATPAMSSPRVSGSAEEVEKSPESVLRASPRWCQKPR